MHRGLEQEDVFIKQAMADRSVYDATVVRESEVWRKILPNRERSERRSRGHESGLDACDLPQPIITISRCKRETAKVRGLAKIARRA